MRIGLVGVDSSHAEDFLRHFNREGRYGDTSVTAFWAGDDARAAELSAFAPGVVAVATPEELVGDVDCVIVGDRHGNRHLQHALPAIAAGKPVFVDKPFACSVEDAMAMVDAAERSGSPLLSGSALRWQEQVVMLKARLAYLEGPVSIRAHGTWYPDSEYGGAIFYAIHVIELVQELIGTQWSGLHVQRGASPSVRYQGGSTSVTLNFRPAGIEGSAFGIAVESSSLACDRPITLGDDYMAPVADRIVQMLRSGRGMDRETLLAPVRMMGEIEALLAGL